MMIHPTCIDMAFPMQLPLHYRDALAVAIHYSACFVAERLTVSRTLKISQHNAHKTLLGIAMTYAKKITSPAPYPALPRRPPVGPQIPGGPIKATPITATAMQMRLALRKNFVAFIESSVLR
jgi:hypothetical protein